jgi:hypothetical protein
MADTNEPIITVNENVGSNDAMTTKQNITMTGRTIITKSFEKFFENDCGSSDAK